MNIQNVDKTNIQINLCVAELRLILASIREVGEILDEFEFYARVGGSKESVHRLCVELKTQMEKANIEI